MNFASMSDYDLHQKFMELARRGTSTVTILQTLAANPEIFVEIPPETVFDQLENVRLTLIDLTSIADELSKAN